ncbi:hypothetical protein AO385_1153 [Moraxella catarrhalis]|uniref:Uncharacterized protein n=1 Tax=Moraxella catarrhalis TaxID=480 RepID=A0A198UMG5_MORCA|nr:hypothetical protein AO383_1604 [Moraxella catarrhalis]OAU97683.1 hypothetical protein AO384_0369 [Moraxella catarrhalis]OAV00757.1 hypothetical protein AO385_1153 [Moraxella catarrhalis]
MFIFIIHELFKKGNSDLCSLSFLFEWVQHCVVAFELSFIKANETNFYHCGL